MLAQITSFFWTGFTPYKAIQSLFTKKKESINFKAHGKEERWLLALVIIGGYETT